MRVASLFIGFASGVEIEQTGLLQMKSRHQIEQTLRLDGCEYESFSEDFDRLVQSCEVLATSMDVEGTETEYKFAHEAPVYIPKLGKVMFSSNRLGEGEDQTIEILTVDVETGAVEKLPEKVWKEDLVMANGAVLNMMAHKKDKALERDAKKITEVLVASQGNMQKKSGIYKLDLEDNSVTEVLTVSGWEGKEFNSLNDLAVDPKTGGIVFTDPAYGFAQGFRPKPSFGGVVWGFLPHNWKDEGEHGELHNVRMLEDHFRRPNGIAFADNGNTMLVSDSGMFPGAEFVSEYDLVGGTVPDSVGAIDWAGPRHTYAYKVVRGPGQEIVGLTDRRTAFIAQAGVPDGVKLDCEGRIYTGVGNGVAIYDKYGTHLGTLKAPDGCANLVLVPGRGRQSEIVALCERQIWKYTIKAATCDIRARKTF